MNEIKLSLAEKISSFVDITLPSPQRLFLFGKYKKNAYLVFDKDNGFHLQVEHSKGANVFNLSNFGDAQKFYDELYVVPKNVTDNLKAFKAFIMDCEVDVYYEINFRQYKTFEISKSYNNIGYSWRMNNKDGIFDKYPKAKEKGYVKQFPSIEEAKKDLIKEIKSYFRK